MSICKEVPQNFKCMGAELCKDLGGVVGGLMGERVYPGKNSNFFLDHHFKMVAVDI